MQEGLTFVHPYDDPDVIAGQGTCSKEFIEQTDGLDMVVAPIGGGGMISGTCLTLATLAPECQVIAAEPEQADDAYRSFKAGHIIADDAPKTIADGLLVPLKDLTWHFVSTHVSDILTASEDEIVEAMKLIVETESLTLVQNKNVRFQVLSTYAALKMHNTISLQKHSSLKLSL